MNVKLIKKSTITNEEIIGIEKLVKFGQEIEHVHILMKWNTLKSRSNDKVNDFFYFDNDEMVGFLNLYQIVEGEIELSGYIHPNYRRQHLFTNLVLEALKECSDRDCKKVLFITDHSSLSGKSFLENFGAKYNITEYKMDLIDYQNKDYPQNIILRKANEQDSIKRAEILKQCFGYDVSINSINQHLKQSNRFDYVLTVGDDVIGNIEASNSGKEVLIYGIAIVPHHQNKGYGRIMLNQFIKLLLNETNEKITLEVASQNNSALHLYTSTGFKEVSAFDYYQYNI